MVKFQFEICENGEYWLESEFGQEKVISENDHDYSLFPAHKELRILGKYIFRGF